MLTIKRYIYIAIVPTDQMLWRLLDSSPDLALVLVVLLEKTVLRDVVLT